MHLIESWIALSNVFAPRYWKRFTKDMASIRKAVGMLECGSDDVGEPSGATQAFSVERKSDLFPFLMEYSIGTLGSTSKRDER